LLIAEGANVNTRTIEGVTPLATAVAMGYDDIAIILRQHGARK
jgi:ankyrin repeat protein